MTELRISIKEYEDLMEDRKMLHALIEAGVDNWSGYEIALEILQEMAETIEGGFDDEL